MPECTRCGREQIDDTDLVVSVTEYGGEQWCFPCRKSHLKDETILSHREAEVIALKQITGNSHGDIAEILELDKSTVDEYSRRARKKFFRAAETVEALETNI